MCKSLISSGSWAYSPDVRLRIRWRDGKGVVGGEVIVGLDGWLRRTTRLDGITWIAGIATIKEQMVDQVIEVDGVGEGVKIEVAPSRGALWVLNVVSVEEDDVNAFVEVNGVAKP